MAGDTVSERLTPKQRVFADGLLSSGAVKFGAFRLKLHETQPDAPLSPMYVDLRVLRSFPDALDAAVAVLQELIERDGLQFTRYADVPMAATPLVAVLSHLTRVPMITPRETKTHGAGGSINGFWEEGETALVIDDVVTHADSKIEAIRTLEANGLVAKDVVVLVDREQGGPQAIAAAGYTLHAAVKISDLLAYWRATGGISEADYQRVADYFATTKAQ